MDEDQAREISERDQLWASLRALRDPIARLAAGEFDGTDRQKQIILILARVVDAEIGYRERHTAPEAV